MDFSLERKISKFVSTTLKINEIFQRIIIRKQLEPIKNPKNKIREVEIILANDKLFPYQ
jgi:hypothetical protein